MKLTIVINEKTQPLLTLTLHDEFGSAVLAEAKSVALTHSRECIEGPPTGILQNYTPGERRLTIDATTFTALHDAIRFCGRRSTEVSA